MGILKFRLEGIVDIDEEFSYVARATGMGWLAFSYIYSHSMEKWAEEAGIEMQRIKDKTGQRERPGYAFRTEADRLMFLMAWS